MSTQVERLRERDHCQLTPLTLPSSSLIEALSCSPCQPRGGLTVTTPSSSASTSVTVTASEPVRPPSLESTERLNDVVPSSKLGGVLK